MFVKIGHVSAKFFIFLSIGVKRTTIYSGLNHTRFTSRIKIFPRLLFLWWIWSICSRFYSCFRL